MKKTALMLVFLFTASTGFNAVAADSNSPANGSKKGDVKKPAPEDEMPHVTFPPPPSTAEAASGSISGTTLAYIAGGVLVIAAAAGGGGGGGSSGTSGTH